MLTRAGFALLSAAVILLVAALPGGNLFLVALSLLPLTLFLLAAVGDRPKEVTAKISLPGRPVRTGDSIEVVVDYTVRGGSGILELHQPIPGVFTLENGSNLRLVPKPAGRRSGRFAFKVRCTRRGHFVFPPLDWELVPSLGFAKSHRGLAGTAVSLDVRPALASAKRMVRLRGRATQFFPENDLARLGVQTTEFRDIRDYVRGDPPKTINWKATARMLTRMAAARGKPSGAAGNASAGPGTIIKPLVNEYEHEGKKTVWVYLDCGPYMRVGTSAENVFEAAVHAATASTHYFLERGYRVGFSLFNRPDPVNLPPDVGSRQLLQVQEVLANAEPTTTRGSFPLAVAETKRHLLLGRGLAIVITRADLADGTLLAGLRRLRALTGKRRKRAPVLVVSPDPFGLLPEVHAGTAGARAVLRHLNHERLQEVRRLGVQLLAYDPRRTRFEEVLMRRTVVR